MFEGINGLAQAVSIDELCDLMRTDARPRLVFVAACHSEAAARAFIEAGVPCVVSVHLEDTLLDAAVIKFTQQFYAAVLAGRTVRQSFDAAISVVRTAPELQHTARGDRSNTEADKFRLQGSDEDLDRPVLPPSLAPANPRWQQSMPWMQAPPRCSGLPMPPEGFLGRNLPTREVVDAIARGRLVTLHGPPGMGKHSVALAAARYAHERGLFPSGVRALSCDEAETAEIKGDHDHAELIIIKGLPSRDSLERLTRHGKVHVLVTAQSTLPCSPSSVIERQVKLEPLDDTEAKLLLKTCCGSRRLTSSDMPWALMKELNGNPDVIRREAGRMSDDLDLDSPSIGQLEIGALAEGAAFVQLSIIFC